MTFKEYQKRYPACQTFHSGLWGWREYLGGLDLSKATFRSKKAAERDRDLPENYAEAEALQDAIDHPKTAHLR